MPERPDYDKLTDPEINRLCAERLESMPLNAEKSIAAMYRNASLPPDYRERAEAELMYMQLSNPKALAVAFLKATET